MQIKNGGQLEKFDNKKLEKIEIQVSSNGKKYSYELWLNGDSLSFLTLQELIELRDEINDALKNTII